MALLTGFAQFTAERRLFFFALSCTERFCAILESEAKQGLLFTTTHAHPELAVLDETVELSFFYGKALVLQLHFHGLTV